MSALLIQNDDWKKEKHMPTIEAPTSVKSGVVFEVKLSIGKEVPHPNTTEHHIAWIDLFFQPEGEKFPHQVGHFAFTAHGEAVAGPNQGPVYTNPAITVSLRVSKPGTLQALASCNIHGLWQGEQAVALD